MTSSLQWALAGCALAGLLSVVALRRSLDSAHSNYFEHEVYGMDSGAHRRWALVGLLFALAFLASAFVPSLPSLPIFAAFTVAALLYAASFARGASEEEEP